MQKWTRENGNSANYWIYNVIFKKKNGCGREYNEIQQQNVKKEINESRFLNDGAADFAVNDFATVKSDRLLRK